MNDVPHPAPPPRYRIVRDGPDRRRLWQVLLALAWAGSVFAAWQVSRSVFAPGLPEISGALASSRQTVSAQRDELDRLRQRVAILETSDGITRDANKQVQRTLAEREDEIAGLREDVAFYERLVGATSPRKGLNVHSAQFMREVGGTWRYELVLTQNLNRGAVSRGALRFSIEGVDGGKLASIDWNRLHQREAAPAQAYSFRYFQQLSGSVMLPEGFTPQHVKIRLDTGERTLDQTIAWQAGEAAPGAADSAVTAVAVHEKKGES
ncbi:DUF6776 family protein [Marilutibacter penaei]